jgi:hypothetical protein
MQFLTQNSKSNIILTRVETPADSRRLKDDARLRAVATLFRSTPPRLARILITLAEHVSSFWEYSREACQILRHRQANYLNAGITSRAKRSIDRITACWLIPP